MAKPTKNARSLVSNQSVAASGSANGTLDLRTAFGGILTALIGIGGSNDGSASEVLVEVSDDNSNWREFQKVKSGTSTSTDYEFVFEIPMGVMYLKVTITNNDGSNAITAEATLQEVTSIA